MSDARGAASWDAKRATPAEQAAHGEGYDQAVEEVWDAPVCSACGADHDADESAMCEHGEVVSFREWVEAAARLREQLGAARNDVREIQAWFRSAPWEGTPDPGAFVGQDYSPAERAKGYGTYRDPRFLPAALGVEGEQEKP